MLQLLNLKEKKNFYIFIFLMSIFSFLEVFNLSLILPILENLLSANNNKSDYLLFIEEILGKDNFLVLLTIFFFLLMITKNIYLIIITYFQNRFIYDFKFRLTNNLFDKIISLTYQAFHQKNSSSYVKNLVGDTNQITQCISMLITLYSDCLILLCIFLMLFFVDFKIAIITFVILLFITFLYYRFFKKVFKGLGKKRYIYEANIYKTLNNTLGAFLEINLFKKKFFFKDYFSLNNKLNNTTMEKYTFLQSLPRVFFELIGVSILILLFLYYQSIPDISIQSILPKMSLFVLCLIRLMPLFNRITLSIQNIKFANQTGLILFNELNQMENISLKNVDKKIKNKAIVLNAKSEIIIKDLNFIINDKKIINNLNLKITYGEKIGIYGESGSGKSTFAKLFSGLILPSAGTINLNESNIFNNLHEWQENISYLKQDNFILDDSIKNNICFGEEKIDLKKLNQSVKETRLDKLISGLPEGLNTNIGENGQKISGGEKQRICLARSLYHNKKIFIFDEPTSALDDENEKLIMDCINSLDGKLVILISHNKKIFTKFNKIYNFEEGKLFFDKNLSIDNND